MSWWFFKFKRVKTQSDDCKSHHFATHEDLRKLEIKIMSVVSDYVAKQKTFNDAVSSSIDGLVGDVKGLNDKIQALVDQLNQGQVVTAEDIAALNELGTAGEALVAKAKAADDLTPPVAPPTT